MHTTTIDLMTFPAATTDLLQVARQDETPDMGSSMQLSWRGLGEAAIVAPYFVIGAALMARWMPYLLAMVA